MLFLIWVGILFGCLAIYHRHDIIYVLKAYWLEGGEKGEEDEFKEYRCK